MTLQNIFIIYFLLKNYKIIKYTEILIFFMKNVIEQYNFIIRTNT